MLLLLKVEKKPASIIAILLTLTFAVFNWNLVLNPGGFVSYFDSKYFNPEIIEVARWIKDSARDNIPIIMARHEGIAWYAGGETVYLPQGDLSKIINYARYKNVDYIVAWDGEISGERQLSLLFEEDLIDGLNKVHELKSQRHRFIVYTINE